MSEIGIGEIVVILVVALFVFGPERLPVMVKQAASFVNDLRKMVANARRDLSDSVSDLGIDEEDLKTLRDLRNPRSFLRQKVLDGADLSDLGLDQLEEVGDDLGMTNKNKRRGAVNGDASNATRSKTNSAGKALTAKTNGAGQAARTADTAAVDAGGTDDAGSNGAASSNDGDATADDVLVGPEAGTSGAARYDPDTT